MRYYYYEDANSNMIGPVSDKEVFRLIRDGVLTTETRVRPESGGTWQSVRSLAERPSQTPFTNTPTRSPTLCPHCGGRVSRESLFCANCEKSTVPHIGAKLASPTKRLAASFIDMCTPGLGAKWLSHSVVNGFGGIGPTPLLTVALLAWAVWSMFLFSNGMTPGKWLVGTYVMNKEGDPAGFFRMVVREWIGKPISFLVFGLGYLWILIDENNQGWHDKLVDTYVVED